MRKYIYLSLLILVGCDNHKAVNTELVTNPQSPTPTVEKMAPSPVTPTTKPTPKPTSAPVSNFTNSYTYFSESDFGMSFSHKELITLKYSSPARCDSLSIFFQGVKSGYLTISELPRGIKIDYFLRVGRAEYIKKYNASNFESKVYTTPKGLKFYTLRCHVDYKGASRTLERFIHIVPINSTTYRVFAFEFFLTNRTYNRQHPIFLKMVNTFMLTKPDAE